MSQRAERIWRPALEFAVIVVALASSACGGGVAPAKSASTNASAEVVSAAGAGSALAAGESSTKSADSQSLGGKVDTVGDAGASSAAEEQPFALDDLLKPKAAEDQVEAQEKAVEAAPLVDILQPEQSLASGSEVFGNASVPGFITGDKRIGFVRPGAISGNGDHFYVVDSAARFVFKVNFKKQTLWPIVDLSSQFKGEPGGIFTAKDGSFYVSDPAGRRVVKFSPEGNVVQQFASATNLSRPMRVYVNEVNGHVFVADAVFSRVLVFNAKGVPVYVIGRRGDEPGRFIAPTSFTVHEDSVYATDSVGIRAQKVVIEGEAAQAFGAEVLINPTAIAVDEYGRVFVADAQDNFIKVFKDGHLIGKFGGTGKDIGKFREIADMCIVNDRLYAAEALNRRVQVFKLLPP